MVDPVVSVIVPVRNGGRDLRALLDALAGQTLAPERFEVLVADDGSTDGGTDGIETADGRIRVLAAPAAGAYAARNRACRAARGEVLAFVDADCIPEPRWLEQGLDALRDADLVAGAIRFALPPRPSIWELVELETFKDHRRQVDASNAETANLFVRREVFDRVGGFDEAFAGYSDFAFVQRCVAAGARLTYAPDAAVLHPTRPGARAFLRLVWAMHRSYAATEARAGRRPDGLKLRSWAPVVQTLRSRRRFVRSLALDRTRLAEHGLRPRLRDDLRALPILYVLLPYLGCLAQVRGWRDGRRLRAPNAADVLLACSSGGHLLQLMALRPAWDGFSRVWVTEDATDSRSLLRGERAVFPHPPSTRSTTRLLKDLPFAWRLLGEVRPKVVLTTGAGAALPYAWLGRMRGARVVYVETVTRIGAPSLSCRLIAPIADRVYVQWPELSERVRRARYVGTVLGAPRASGAPLPAPGRRAQYG